MNTVDAASLQNLLFGRSLYERCEVYDVSDSKMLNHWIEVMIWFLGNEHSFESRAYAQLKKELCSVIEMPVNCPYSLTCRRAMILYGLWREPNFKTVFKSEQDQAFISDLCTRVLPITSPQYLRGIGQRPDTYVYLCSLMHNVWSEVVFEERVRREEGEDGEDGEKGGGTINSR